MRVKKKKHENLSNANIRHVMTLLTPSDGAFQKPITKKEACEILNISYNTLRLQKIIDEYKEHTKFVEKRKSQNRGKRARPAEITQVLFEYLSGEPVSEIAKGLFRSSGFVRGIIERIGVPQRPTGAERHRVAFLPEVCISELYEVGMVVWSAKYHAPAIIIKEIKNDRYERDYGSRCYQISVIEQVDASESYFKHIESGGFYAFALAYDLGSLEHLKKYDVNLNKI